jgi:hypothetical protein
MDAELSKQIESAREALTLSRTRAELVTRKMKKLGVHFGTEDAYAEGDGAQGAGRRLVSLHLSPQPNQPRPIGASNYGNPR